MKCGNSCFPIKKLQLNKEAMEKNIESQKVDTINARIIIIIPALLEFKELGKKLIKVY